MVVRDASRALADTLMEVGYNLYEHPRETELAVVLASVEVYVK